RSRGRRHSGWRERGREIGGSRQVHQWRRGGDGMSAWLTRHAQTSIGSLGRLSQQKFATLLTVFVIGIALALPACLHLLISNAQMATGNWNSAVDLTVFLKRPTSLE